MWFIGGVAFGVLIFLISNAKQVQAQALTGQGTPGCYQTPSARHNCFMQGFEGRMGRAKESAAQRKSIREAKLALQPNYKEEDRVKREAARALLTQQAANSKARNRSHAGQRYVITYGRISEPR